jgi:hypothetical protein
MHGWIPRLIRIVGACGLVDLRVDLLLGRRAGASLPSLSIDMCVGCVCETTLNRSASLLR